MKILKIIDNNKKTLTATGYGKKLHTGKTAIIFNDNKIIKRDIYMDIYSNIGTKYIFLNNSMFLMDFKLSDYYVNQPSFTVDHIDTCLDCFFYGTSKPYFQIPLTRKTTTYKDLLVDCLLSVDWISDCLDCTSDFEYSFYSMQQAIYACFEDSNLNDVFARLDNAPTPDDHETVNVYFEVLV
jgi:hypothetical protein